MVLKPQCKANASLMKKTCQLSCGVCHPKPTATPIPTDNDQCQLYLAESTVPGGGLGLYSATPLQPGDVIPTIADIVIQLNDVDYNDGLRRTKHYIAKNATDVKLMDVLSSMVWDPSKQTGAEFDAIDIKSLSSGIGTTAKREIRRSGLANVLLGMPEVDSGRLHRQHHAGSGAISAYHNRAGVALKEIPAGMELFVAYGEDMFGEKVEGQEDSSLSSSTGVLDALFELSGKVDISGFDKDLYDMVVSHLKEKTSLSLPDSLDDAKEIHRFSGLSPEEATAQSARSVRWLKRMECASIISMRDYQRTMRRGEVPLRPGPSGRDRSLLLHQSFRYIARILSCTIKTPPVPLISWVISCSMIIALDMKSRLCCYSPIRLLSTISITMANRRMPTYVGLHIPLMPRSG